MLFLFQFLALFQIIQENWKHVFIFRPETFQNIQICIFCFPDVLLKECLKDDWQNAAPLRKNLQGNAPPNDFEELQVVGWAGHRFGWKVWPFFQPKNWESLV